MRSNGEKLGDIDTRSMRNGAALTGFLFAVAGGLIALALSGEAFGISAAIGFVSLPGISVMNGVILITAFNDINSNGLTPVEAMFQAVSQRMRAVLMTAFSAAVGLIPAAFQRPLASLWAG